MINKMLKQYRIKRCRREIARLENERTKLGPCEWNSAEAYVAKERLRALTGGEK